MSSETIDGLACSLGELLKSSQQTVAVSESSTGGLISAALLAVPGASVYFMGGGVIYTHRARQSLLGLGPELPDGIRAASEPYATLCANTIREKLVTTWGLAEAGAAGPSGNRYGDAAGHCCIAVSGPVERCATLETRSANRAANMWAFARAALEMLEDAVRSSQ